MTRRGRARALLAALALAAACAGSAPAGAQAVRAPGGGSGPVVVEAEDGIEWIGASRMYVARGNAVATRGELRVSGDTLTAFYRDAGSGDTEIHRLEALGNVTVAAPGRMAFGDRAVYDLDRRVAAMWGGDLRLVTEGRTITARESLEYWGDLRAAVARGGAVAAGADGRRIRADALTARFAEGPDGALEAVRVDAVGNVEIVTPTEVARGREGVYDVRAGVAVLSGDVRITRGETQLNGARAEVNLETGLSRIVSAGNGAGGGRVRALLVPESRKAE